MVLGSKHDLWRDSRNEWVEIWDSSGNNFRRGFHHFGEEVGSEKAAVDEKFETVDHDLEQLVQYGVVGFGEIVGNALAAGGDVVHLWR